jgi:predicted dehydrogenase
MQQIRWGIIGCGNVTEVKSGPGFQKAEGASLVAVMRRNAEKAADYAKRHGVPTWYNDALKLIEDPQVDAIYIATHPDTHHYYTLLAASKGKPVYCEKPLGVSYAQSKEMVEYCKLHSIPFFSAYYRRALPKYLMIKEMIDSGKLGEIRAVHVEMLQTIKPEDKVGNGRWRVQPEMSGGSLLLDVGSHSLDLVDFYFGPIVEATGEGRNQSKTYEADDIVHGSFRTERGVCGTGIWCFNTCKDEDTTTIFGSKGILSYSVLDVGKPITLETATETQVFEVPEPPEHIAQPLIQTITDELLGKGHCPSTGESGMRTDWVMERLQGK